MIYKFRVAAGYIGPLLPESFMLSCIRKQHCRIAAFSRCPVTDRGMASLKVIGVDIFTDSCSGFPDIVILCQIGFLLLEAAEPSFDHDIICPSAFPVHALTNAIFFDEVNVLLACELATMIGIYVMSTDHA